jgi:hypothetical protein
MLRGDDTQIRTGKHGMPANKPRQHFFHGTSALPAVCIAIDGFRLLDEALRRFGRGCLGGGTYLTAAPKTAVWFSMEEGYVLRIRLAPGTRILRLDGHFDQKVIDSLRREFGAAVLSPNFDRALPQNKKLRRVELVNLLNYLWGKELLGWFTGEHRQVRRYLAKSGYHGMGNTESDIGVVIFNPSRLVLDSVLRRSSPPPELTEAEPGELLAQAAREFCAQLRWVPMDGPQEDSLDPSVIDGVNALLRELPRWQRCLQRFAERHHLSVDQPDIRSALEASIPRAFGNA